MFLLPEQFFATHYSFHLVLAINGGVLSTLNKDFRFLATMTFDIVAVSIRSHQAVATTCHNQQSAASLQYGPRRLQHYNVIRIIRRPLHIIPDTTPHIRQPTTDTATETTDIIPPTTGRQRTTGIHMRRPTTIPAARTHRCNNRRLAICSASTLVSISAYHNWAWELVRVSV